METTKSKLLAHGKIPRRCQMLCKHIGFGTVVDNHIDLHTIKNLHQTAKSHKKYEIW